MKTTETTTSITELMEAAREEIRKSFPEADWYFVQATSGVSPKKGRKDTGGNVTWSNEITTGFRVLVRIKDGPLADCEASTLGRAIYDAGKRLRELQKNGPKSICEDTFGKSSKKVPESA